MYNKHLSKKLSDVTVWNAAELYGVGRGGGQSRWTTVRHKLPISEGCAKVPTEVSLEEAE